MRSFVVFVMLFSAALAGCTNPRVDGSGAVHACGTAGKPGVATLSGRSVNWVGVEILAEDDRVTFEVASSQLNLAWFTGVADVEAWVVAAVDPGTNHTPQVVAATVGLAKAGDHEITAHVGGDGPHRALSKPGLPVDAKLLGPTVMTKGQRFIVFAATAVPTAASIQSVHLAVSWVGCASTSEPVGGFNASRVAWWKDLKAPLLVSSPAVGTVAAAAVFEESRPLSLVVAKAPAAKTAEYGPSTITTSRARVDLNATPSFLVHDTGTLRYESTYVGDAESGRTPLAAVFELPLEKLEGPIHRHDGSWFFP